MVSPAPIPTIEEKLRSGTEAVRLVALWHASRHGTAAVALAPTIARMFEDPSAAVQWHAMRTFLAVGDAAADAVPILVEQLRKGAPKMLVARALAALGTVGPPARSALEAVLEAWRSTSGHDRSSALEALLRIAPEAPAVRALFFEALYSEDYAERSSAHRFLTEARDEVVDGVAADARSRMAAADDEDARATVAQVLVTIAPARPTLVAELVEPLLERLGEPCVSPAIAAASKLPRPLSSALLERTIRVAASEDQANERAIQLLSELGAVAAPARSVLIAQLNAHADSVPMGGPAGRSSYVFRSAALALAAACPDAKEVVPILVAWLSRVPSLALPKGKKPSWYTIRDVALAAAKLDPTSGRVVDQIVSVAEASRRWLDADASGVRDFERKLREIVGVLGAPPELWQRLEALGIARVDDEDERETEEASEGQNELPDFPPEEAPPEPLRAAPLPEEIFHEIAAVLPSGEAHAGVEEGATPEDVATAIDAAIRRAHRERRLLPEDEIIALGALWGSAVARATGWTWAHVVHGEARWICLVSKDHAHACAPLAFLKQQADPKRETTVLLLFNMIRGGNLPDANAGQLSFLG